MLDTNILLRLTQLPGLGTKSFLEMVQSRYLPYICFQNLAEYWTVASRPKENNGLGLSVDFIKERIEWMREIFEFVPENSTAVDQWLEICSKQAVVGKRVHDLKLVAIAISSGITKIITINPADFRGIPGISVSTPELELSNNWKES